MRRFLNNRISNYNNVGDKVDDFCEDCENRWLPFSRVWWDSTEKNIADIKRKDNGIFVIKKILSLINSISESIKDIYDKINVIEPPILSEKLLELENDYLEVGVTADDKQEDLNIAIYENYINLKNTKVDKPLIESTSDSLKIVALDNQGESVFIKSNELGKVKSVNNKIGDVILKTSDLENDSDYTTNLKLNQERGERISGDNLKLDKPTTSGTTTTHPNIVGVDDLGNSAKLKATDFGKVDTIDGIEADENKDVKLGAVRKSKSNEVEAGFDLHQKDGASIGVDVNGVNVFKGGITATFGTTSIYVDNMVFDADYKFQEILFPKRAVKNVEEKVYPVTYVQGVKADETGRVDISGIPWNYTSSNIRYSGILDKSADATYNQLLGVDSNGNAAKVGLNAITNAMAKSTDAQKDAFRLASRKTGENYSTGQPQPFAVFPPIVENSNEIQEVVVVGSNLFLNNQSLGTALVSLVSEDTGTEYPLNVEVNQTNPSVLSFGYNFRTLPLGKYWIKIIHNGLVNINKVYIEVLDIIINEPLPSLSWNGFRLSTNTYFTDANNTTNFVSFTPTAINFTRKYNALGGATPYLNEGNVFINSSAFNLPNDFYLEFIGTCPWQAQDSYGARQPTISMGLSAYNSTFDVSNTYIAGFGLASTMQNSVLLSDTSVTLNMGNVTNFVFYVIKRGSKIVLGLKSKSGVLYSTYTAPVGNQFMIKLAHFNRFGTAQNTLISFALTKILSL